MSKLIKRANQYGLTNGRTDSKHRKASLVKIYQISRRLQNRLISAGLEPVLSHTDSCIASYDRQFSMNIKIKKNKINTSYVLFFCFFHFNIHRKLPIIRCNRNKTFKKIMV